MPNQITVTNTNDSGAGSLRDALAQNDANGGNSTVVFAPGLAGSTIYVQSTLGVNDPVTIDGGANNITINGSHAITEFTVNDAVAGSPVTIQNLTMANGQGFGGSGAAPGAPGGNAAGGVFVQNAAGGITLANDTFSGDNATGGVGYSQGVSGQPGVGGDAGGAILVQNGALTLRSDSFVNDGGGGGQGGGSGGGALGGNAAGAVYVESTGSVAAASQLTSNNTSASGGGGGGGQVSGTGYAVSNNGTVTANDTIVCYASGTRIRAMRSGSEVDVAVENLHVGDLAVTASGERRPVRWLGHRTVNCRCHPDSLAVQPIRIKAHAFGEGRPARDLRVSPGHSVCVDLVGEVLVPASVLVNGATVVREDVESVTYWHIELDSHDLLLAEGLPAESYLDMGNRAFFASSSVVKLAAVPDACPDSALRTHADFCRPFHDAGPLVTFLRERLHAQALALGWQLAGGDPWAGAHLLVDGVRVEGEVRGLSARFVLPAGARDVWLVSDTSVPCEVGINNDGRRLGLSVAGLRVDNGWCEPRRVALDDPLLCVGFHGVEGEAGVPSRWTAGWARLPAALWAGWDGPVAVRLDLADGALPRWVAPDAARAAPGRPAVRATAA